MIPKVCIFSHTQEGFAREIFAILRKGKAHASILYSQWFRKGRIDLESLPIEAQAKGLIEKMLDVVDFSLPEVSACRQEGKTHKFLLRYSDLLESESVIIPMESGVTLCISSQIGCKMGCTFCETGRMGLLRHLESKEIVAQVFIARFIFNMPVRNIVFMGMGEPLDNFEAVLQAVRILTDPAGWGLGPSRITISTSGIVEGIYRLAQEADPALNLAVSINAPNDVIRNKIMPVNRKWNLVTLKEAMVAYTSHPRRKIFAEYVLIQGVNDSLSHAEELADYLQGIPVKINVIPYNPQSKDRFAPPEGAVIEAFLQRLREKGYQALLRHPKGQGIMAACGQLGNLRLRQQLYRNNTNREFGNEAKPKLLKTDSSSCFGT